VIRRAAHTDEQRIREALNYGGNYLPTANVRDEALAALARLVERLETAPKVLAADEVCACLDETGSRQVTVWERCVRCSCFMESDLGAELARAEQERDEALQDAEGAEARAEREFDRAVAAELQLVEARRPPRKTPVSDSQLARLAALAEAATSDTSRAAVNLPYCNCTPSDPAFLAACREWVPVLIQAVHAAEEVRRDLYFG